MKKIYLYLLIIPILFFGIYFFTQASDLAVSLSGKILLQVEENGEAWYVSPETKKRSFLGRPDDAFNIMRQKGIGITNSDLAKIPVSLDYLSGLDTNNDKLPDAFKEALGLDINSTDSDGDGFDDYTELLYGYDPLGPGKLNHDLNFAKNQAGRILLQVEQNGEAWYVSPENNKRYFLGRPNDAFNIMRNLGLGISNVNLEKIINSNKKFATEVSDCDVFPDKLDACEPFICNFEHPFTSELMKKEIIGLKDGKCQYTEEMPNNGRMDCEYTESLRKAIAQYYKDLANSESSGTSVKFDSGSADVETIYTIDGKEVKNPLQEAINNGQCIISGYDNPSSNLNGDLIIEWGEFIKTKDWRDEDKWEMDINIINNRNKMVILDLRAIGKERNWSWGSSDVLDSGESKTFYFDINLYSFDDIAFDKKKIDILAYECDKLSESDEEELCVSAWGFDGKLSPWQILKNNEDAGTPISPTTSYTKYFDYNNLELPPLEISAEEY